MKDLPILFSAVPISATALSNHEAQKTKERPDHDLHRTETAQTWEGEGNVLSATHFTHLFEKSATEKR